ncbi:MAG: hypothetical protein ACI3V3_01830 [Faecousia sp.]
MKKNRTMRVSTLLLALTLITSCFVGGTFAKYTTTTGDTVTARVANWGFERTNMITLDSLFSNSYVKNGATGNAVKASDDTTLLIAPGTTGSVSFQFKYDETAKNAPEVAYTFTVDTDGSKCSLVDGVLVWSLDGEVCGTGTFDELLADIEALSGDASGTKEYAPNTLPDAFGTDDTEHTISWTWAFDESQDARDTGLGNANTLGDVTVAITITATQID